MPVTEQVILEGHLLDAAVLANVTDTIRGMQGECVVQELHIGRSDKHASRCRLAVTAPDRMVLDRMLDAIRHADAGLAAPQPIVTKPAPKDGVFPDNFYVTSNYPTQVWLNNKWVDVADPEMDCSVAVDRKAGTARTVAMFAVKKGEEVIVGNDGVRQINEVAKMGDEGKLEAAGFAFMNSAVSSERPNESLIAACAAMLKEIRDKKGTTIFVGGPAIVHTGSREALAKLIHAGYIHAFFAGNALATHDLEAAIYKTSLGMCVKSGSIRPHGHEHHLRTLNTIRNLGGIAEAVKQGLVKDGIMHACVVNKVPFVLAGSIRDDGPLPEVITDALKAQDAMREHCRKASATLMVATMLHSVATGNLLPSSSKVVCVDINPATITKLCDRGTHHTVGIVTDTGLFLHRLWELLKS